MNMTRYFKHLLALGITVTAAMTVPSHVNAQDDFRALYERFLFHEVGVNARSAAMGGAYSALQGGDMGLSGNPASLGFLEDPYFSVDFSQQTVSEDGLVSGGFNDPGTSRSEYESDMYTFGGGVAYPFEWGGLALNYNYRDDEVDSADALFASGNAHQQPSELTRHSISLGGGYRLQDVWAVGYRYSYIDIERDIDFNLSRPQPGFTEFTSSRDVEGHNSHIGLQYMANDNVVFGMDGTFGFGDRNIGNTDFDNDSWSIRGGIAGSPMADYPLLLALDVSYTSLEVDLAGGNDIEDDIIGVHLGGEYEAMDNLFLRAGYRFEDYDFEAAAVSDDPSVHSLTAGFGYIYNQFTLDYGFQWSDTNDGDISNFVSLGIRF